MLSVSFKGGANRPGLRRMVVVVALSMATLILLAVVLGRWLNYPTELRHGDAIVVLGGRQTLRMEHAISLYFHGYAPELWHTGDVPPPGARLSQAGRARNLAVARGVPLTAITLLPTRSTWQDGEAIAALARERGARRLLLVTDWMHSRRAVCTLRDQLVGSGVSVSYASPPPLIYTPESWWYSADGLWSMRRELPALVYYWVYYGVNPFRC